nr:hypothetical transcript [Hymenolepis microstoma]
MQGRYWIPLGWRGRLLIFFNLIILVSSIATAFRVMYYVIDCNVTRKKKQLLIEWGLILSSVALFMCASTGLQGTIKRRRLILFLSMLSSAVSMAAEIFIGVIVQMYLKQPLLASAYYVCSGISIGCAALAEKFRQIIYLKLEREEGSLTF